MVKTDITVTFIVAQRPNETFSGCILRWWNQGIEGHRSSSDWPMRNQGLVFNKKLHCIIHRPYQLIYAYFFQAEQMKRWTYVQTMDGLNPFPDNTLTTPNTVWWCRSAGLIGNPKVWVVQWCRMCGGVGWSSSVHDMQLYSPANISQLPTKTFLLTKTCYSLSHLKEEES